VLQFCFASLSMLLLDTRPTTPSPIARNEGSRADRVALRQRGIRFEISTKHELAAALQAHHKGDYAQERTHYKQVLKMLREENKNAYTGVTGTVSAREPPNDEDLDSLLRTLLR